MSCVPHLPSRRLVSPNLTPPCWVRKGSHRLHFNESYDKNARGPEGEPPSKCTWKPDLSSDDVQTFLNTYNVPGTKRFPILIQWFLTTTLAGQYYWCSHFTDEEAQALSTKPVNIRVTTHRQAVWLQHPPSVLQPLGKTAD